MNRYIQACWAYGFARLLVYAPPRKPEEYMIDRFVRLSVLTAAAPAMLPINLYVDLKNAEHLLRRMTGQVDLLPLS